MAPVYPVSWKLQNTTAFENIRRAMIKALILSPHPNVLGGVTNFVEILRDKISPEIQLEHFVIGRRPDEFGLLNTCTRLILDAFNFLKLVNRKKFDIVHINPSLTPSAVLRDGLFLLLLRICGFKKTIIFFRGWSPGVEYCIGSSAVLRWMFRWTYSWVPMTLVLSSHFRSWLISLGFDADRIRTTSTMFDGSLLVCARAEVRKLQDTEGPASGTEKPLTTILFMSRIVRDKGVFELVESFRGLSSCHPELHLVIAGDGKDLPDLKRKVEELGLSDRIDFPGYLTGLNKAHALIGAQIFVLPSSHGDGMPNALLEAMGAGLAVVTTRVGGIPEVVDDTENGILLDQVTSECLESALGSLIRDNEYRQSLAAKASQKAWDRYESKIVIQKLENIYKLVAAAS